MTCPTCAMLEAQIAYWARLDWWTWFDLCAQLAEHVRTHEAKP